MFLIDGYNLLHAMGKGNAGPEGREEMVRRIAEFCRRGRYRARVVFDATAGAPSRRRAGPVEVRCVPPGRTADEEILEALASTSDRTAFALVSNDRELVREARKRGARAMACKEFAAAMEAPGPGEPPEKTEGLRSDATNCWMREFGFDKKTP